MSTIKDNSKSPPRLSVPISEEQRLRKCRLIPWGMEGAIMRKLLDQLLDLVESKGEMVFACVLRDKITTEDLLQLGDKEREKDKKREE